MPRTRSGGATSSRRDGPTTIAESPLGQLRKARAARGPRMRAKYARAGLAQTPEDAETRWLLLRQLYISHLEAGALAEARLVALEMLGVFEEVDDVARFDLARVLLALGDWDAAREQLVLGERLAPPSRKWEHLFGRARLEGALGRPELALEVLDSTAKSVVRLGQEAIVHGAVLAWKAQAGRGARRSVLGRAYERISVLRPLPAFGQFVGALLLASLERPETGEVLEEFLQATARLPAVARLSLQPEVHWARLWLGKPQSST